MLVLNHFENGLWKATPIVQIPPPHRHFHLMERPRRLLQSNEPLPSPVRRKIRLRRRVWKLLPVQGVAG